ncbi:hypothetical protein PFMALIP_00857 [Plasmodium falciparum MaliPS096_E11]|uniref:Uncharacterized protein n=1 Tax=Plasmodium falciparum MaliPS096_E11 TaxID=1036727 RepID=A0A024WVV4_PLAFA|nr:hypothetical protein PFMALIP_00857 [Plasmodium falciparum MaliPS096_E11]
MVTHFYILTSLGLILHNIMYTITCSARSATFLRKLSASGVEPTFSQGKVTYLTTGLLGQLNNSSDIKVLLKCDYRYMILPHNIKHYIIYTNTYYDYIVIVAAVLCTRIYCNSGSHNHGIMVIYIFVDIFLIVCFPYTIMYLCYNGRLC